MEPSNYAVSVDHVSKTYDDFAAVSDVSFNVTRGTTFGLLGPNGAGKTTTIRMIMNITIPDSGRIEVLGKPTTDGVRAVGYLPEERGLYRKMKVADQLTFLGEIRGLERAEARRRAMQWLERVGLADRAARKVEELSKGMQQKVQFIGSVIHDPEVMILDEPFSGLDPVNAMVLKDLLQEFKSQGRTIILSTHVMEQAEKLCDEIALINRSRVVLAGSLAEIRRQFSGNRLIVRGRGDVATLRSIASVANVSERADVLDVELANGRTTSDFVREAAALYEFSSIVPHEASLDEIFVKVVGEDQALAGRDAA